MWPILNSTSVAAVCLFQVLELETTPLLCFFCSPTERVGELPYLAPELLDGAPVSPAADCFAMGCVFGVFLTKGTHPFGRGLEAVANIVAARGAHFAGNGKEKRKQKKKPTNSSSFSTSGRSELEPYGDLIGRMVEHQPERRPVLSRVVQRLEPKPESPPQPQLELQPQRVSGATVSSLSFRSLPSHRCIPSAIDADRRNRRHRRHR